MSRADYDDWNISGQEYDNYSSGETSFNSKLNSGLIVYCCFALIIFGLICLYSASYPYLIENNLPDYSVVLRQFLYIIIGLVLGAAVLVMPQKLMEMLCPVFMIVCLVVFGLNVFIRTPLLLSETSINIIFLAEFMYLSLFFANRTEGIKKLRDLSLPIVFTLVFLALILLQTSFAYGFLFTVIAIIMFACGGVGFFGDLLLIFYAVVPTTCWILSDADSIQTLLNFMIPGYFESVSGITTLSKSAVASGHFFGKGLGNGEFKQGLIPDISGEYIFCNIAEELGFAGVCILFVLFAIVIYCSFRSAAHLRHQNRFYSNLSCAVSVIFTAEFLLNISSVLGIIPVYGFSLPFFSFGDGIIITVVEMAMIYKMAKSSVKIDIKPENNELNSDTDFEAEYEQ